MPRDPRYDRDPALLTADQVIAQLGQPAGADRTLPVDEKLLELARAYAELARRAKPNVYVTGTAAHEYQCATGIDGIEEARRELTELLLLARPVESDPSRWRLRDRHLDARVALELDGRLAVVTHVHIRDRDAQRYPTPRTRRGR